MTLIPYAGASKATLRKLRAQKPAPAPKPKRKGGFALLPPDRLREISVLGGKIGGPKAPASKRTFSTDRALALAAARKGGLAVQAKRRAGRGLAGDGAAE